jgi:hypothetical protein
MTLKELVLADLQRAQRLITRTHPDPIDPQFRIASPEGDMWIGLTLPDDQGERARRMALIADFMALKLSPGFILASEIHTPDAVLSVGVMAHGYAAAMSLIDRNPAAGPTPAFSEPIWIERERMDPQLFDLLPSGARSLSAARIRELDEWFGPQGRFPAIRIEPR